CAFKPHGAFVHFRSRCTERRTTVALDRCAGLVVHGPAFRFDAKASAQVSAEKTVFSRPNQNSPTPGPGLICQGGEDPVRYSGRNNIYHNLSTLIEHPRGNIHLERDEFEKYLEANEGSDQRSHYLDLAASPLQEGNPLGELPDHLRFQLKR